MRPILKSLLVFVVLAAAGFAAADFAETKKKAEAGKANAQYYLGVLYALGDGVPKDDAEALKWWRLAAEQGNDEAQGILGAAYNEGKLVRKDEAAAVKWYRLAAEQGNAQSQYNLG